MYVYDQLDRQLVNDRVEEFRDQVRRRISGELTEEQFRPLRLMNGLYLQLHAYMLRVAVPYGQLSAVQMRRLGRIARVYDKGYGHFTTRQNIQYNWPKLSEAPDILAELAEVEMHAIQTSGNCIRNTTSDPFAGAAADEIDDPRVWSEIIRQWSTLHPEFSFLPRKFKIAVTGAPNDRAAIKVHDIGIVIVRNAAGEIGFEMWAGGGQGRTPMIARLIRDFVAPKDLLSYLEAMMRVYNRFGRRDNKYKARIKILVHEIGAERYRDEVEAEWQDLRHGAMELPQAEIARIRAAFAPPAFATLPAVSEKHQAKLFEDRAYARWVKSNVRAHKVDGYAIAVISLKPVGGIPGDATAEQMEAVADFAERWSFSEVRVTHEQNLVLPHVRLDDLYDLWLALGAVELDTPNVGTVGDIIACPGLDYCSLANARSIPVSQRISERFADLDRLHDIGELTLNISGCINACGHHHVGNIGILGVDKKGEEFYQITLGGRADENAAIGKIVGPAFSTDQVTDAIETIVETYIQHREPGERFVETYERLGLAPFKEALYGAA
ncbi:MAG: nitrite/sulfite reductase [Pseudomonadota bacterium]|nr:nitrite/sulfite reductase [Pseudomonadota bacterium]